MAAVMMNYPVRDGFQSYPQQYTLYPTRTHLPQSEVTQPLNINPYGHFAHPSDQQQYLQSQSRSSHATSSPVVEEGFRLSLPSISNLLRTADGDRPSQEGASQQGHVYAQQQSHHSQQATPTAPQGPVHQSSYSSQDLSSSQRTVVPPTPPFRNDSVVEGTHSPSTISTGSSLSVAQPYYPGSALNNVEAIDQRGATARFMKRQSVPSQPNLSPFGTSPYNGSSYSHSPGTISNGSYYSPSDPAYAGAGIYQQRALPSNFPPQLQTPVQSAPQYPTKALLEHHHYISASSQASFPQSQDRYICQTCNKAFSRPSSLKIHSHSHTGEKPFKCPHGGCGKAFSVRSNMKRHERGCHTSTTGVLGSSHLG